MTVTERAVRKAGRERLLRDFARAARIVDGYWPIMQRSWREQVLAMAATETSRTRYACLMTAWGL